jgi:dolichyl-diphosphooligosaccharide--protein glycosyltransferase
MRRDVVFVLLIAAAAFGIRTYPAWHSVFTPRGVSFLETDAWYHVRLVENQVRNYPWRVTLDPYAAPGGQFVPIAPLFDTLTATAVVLMHGRDADAADVERIAAFVPPVLGALTIVVIWALARLLFDRRAGLLAATLLAVLPGHFMDRTMLGFVDHHSLEALLAMATTLVLIRGCIAPSAPRGALAGATLGLYLLAWASGSFFVAILGVWLMLFILLTRTTEALRAAASTSGIAAIVALVLVVAFQDPRMHRHGSQIVALGGLASLAFAAIIATRTNLTRWRTRAMASALVVGLAAVAALATFQRGLISQIAIDIARLVPDPARMNVLEARPLFLYSGEWRWQQPWMFFRTGFLIGALAILPFGVRVWRHRRASDLLVLVFAAATFVATIGQNRFGYYLVTACAVLGGWLASWVLDWGGVPHAENPTLRPRTRLPLAREVAVVAVAGGMFAPNVSPTLLLAERTSYFPTHWREAMDWLRNETASPFLQSAARGDDYYYARYSREHVPLPDHTVMNWWDQGYWLAQQARRVAVSNPTQERAPNSARFYAETDEARALNLLRAERSRYVLSDWELPFRRLPDGTIMGRFQSVVDWAAGSHGRYYEILYRRENGGWTPLWVFFAPYYESMAFRLSVLGGGSGVPSNSSTVITAVDRVDATGLRFREAVTLDTYPSYEAARQAATTKIAGDTRIVGLNPWVTAFPVAPLHSLTQVYAARAPDQPSTETPMVRIFELR